MSRKLLLPLSYIYSAAMRGRNFLYKKNFLNSIDIGGKTVSVGNLTLGGTGKTPLAAYIAEFLAENGETVCILTRGYGRRDENKRVVVSDGSQILAGVNEAGDEPFELAQKLLGRAAVVADADRASAGLWAREKLKSSAFILDDGFQHLRVRRCLDLICIDAMKPFGLNGHPLPAGSLREPLSALRRADAIIITRSGLGGPLDTMIEEISRNSDSPIFLSSNKIKGGAGNHKEKNPFAFCAIGNPDNFFSQIEKEGISLAGKRSFPDHFRYSQNDASLLSGLAEESGADCFFTTAKDATKLAGIGFSLPIEVIESELVFENEESFRGFLVGKLCLNSMSL